MAEQDMPRKAVVSKVAKANGFSKVEAERVLGSVLDAMAEELADRGRFHVAEIGSISIVERPPRRYFNPRSRKEAISGGDISLRINISKKMRKRLGRL